MAGAWPVCGARCGRRGRCIGRPGGSSSGSPESQARWVPGECGGCGGCIAFVPGSGSLRRSPCAPVLRVRFSAASGRAMKPPKPWWSDGGGGLLHLALLLSLAGLRADLDLDLSLLLLRGEPRLGAGPCPAWGGLPKGGEPDPATAAADAGRLLLEVRALGAPFVRRTRVDAWLVHGVAAGAADGAPGLAGGADGGDPRAAAEEQEETEPAPAEPAAPGRDVGARAREVGR